MNKRTEFNEALKAAVKRKDVIATATVRLIIAAMKDRDIEARGRGNADGIGDAEILSMLQSMVKQRQESHETYRAAGRNDLADREAAEIQIIRGFMPQQMSEDDVAKTVDGLIVELGVKDIKEMGKVMAELKTRYAGQLDMARASGVVKQRLAG